jgi:hypothetical protein
MRKEAPGAEPSRPHDRFELLAYIVDFVRELLKDTAMSLRLYGLVLILGLSAGLVVRAVAVMVLLLRWHVVLATGTSAAVVIVPVASWSIRWIRRSLSSRRQRR